MKGLNGCVFCYLFINEDLMGVFTVKSRHIFLGIKVRGAHSNCLTALCHSAPVQLGEAVLSGFYSTGINSEMYLLNKNVVHLM